MLKVSLQGYRIHQAEFVLEESNPRDRPANVQLQGNVTVPTEAETGNEIVLQLHFTFGSREDSIYFSIQPVGVFKIAALDGELDQAAVENACMPVMLRRLRESVKAITAAYGLPPLELPPFSGEEAARAD